MKKGLLAVVILAALGAVLFIQRSGSKTESQPQAKKVVIDEKAVAVLKQAEEACKVVKAGKFEAEFKGEGTMAGLRAPVKGTVQFDSATERLRMTVTTKDATGAEQSFDLASDGEKVVGVDHSKKAYNHGPYPNARPLLAPGLNLSMPRLGMDSAFRGEMERGAKYDGVQPCEGVPCDVVTVTKGGEGVRWYFGQTDHLPRRMEQLFNLFASPNGTDKTVLTISNLKPVETLALADFQIAAPEGYAETEVGVRPPLLTVGSPAPDWELKTPSGETVRLASLRGNVVVLDFWATWCGPCKMAMPKVQGLHAEFEAKKVKVFGVNCMEDPSGDPEGYMKSKSYTYGLLLNGDNTARAYHVSGIPTFYVIDPQGNIAFAEVGFSDDDRVKEAVKKAMEKSET